MINNLNEKQFHLIRELIQKHTALWQNRLPDLTKQQYSVLMVVASQPGIEQKDLIEATASSKATLAELLKRMENKQLLIRTQSHEDKRRLFISLTEKGQNILKEAQPIAENVDHSFLSRLSEDEQQQLQQLLNTMLHK